jgi:hypothetical protein
MAEIDLIARLFQGPFTPCHNQAWYSISTGVPNMSLHFIYVPTDMSPDKGTKYKLSLHLCHINIPFSVENNLILCTCAILASLPSKKKR